MKPTPLPLPGGDLVLFPSWEEMLSLFPSWEGCRGGLIVTHDRECFEKGKKAV